jgi:hypothetical protein
MLDRRAGQCREMPEGRQGRRELWVLGVAMLNRDLPNGRVLPDEAQQARRHTVLKQMCEEWHLYELGSL